MHPLYFIVLHLISLLAVLAGFLAGAWTTHKAYERDNPAPPVSMWPPRWGDTLPGPHVPGEEEE